MVGTVGMSSAGLPYRLTSKGMRITMFQVSGSLDDFEHGFQGSGNMSLIAGIEGLGQRSDVW